MAMLFWKVNWFVPMVFEYFPDYDIHMRDYQGFDMLRWAVECQDPILVEKTLGNGC